MRGRVGIALTLAGILLGAAAPGSAQEGEHAGAGASADALGDRRSRGLEAVRVERGPRVDGALDEAVWTRAAVARDFVQQDPDPGAPASERTEVRVLHDGESLYLGVRAFDSDPDGIIATEMRRDGDRILEEDNFQVILDTFHDRQSGFMFVTTPLGAKLDQQVSGEGGRSRSFGVSSSVNRDWDAVWHVEARRTVDGWVAEIEIPMITLSFPEGEPQTWGINFMRNIRRKNEQAYWAPIPRAYDLMRVSLAGTLSGLRGMDRGMDLRVKPYAAGGGRRVTEAGVADNSTTSEVGLDLKYGITAGLNLDVTLNTDFAQAEVDDERVNLTRFPLFFPEKRDFFLENAGMFTVGSTSSFGRIVDLFFSRKIGLSRSGQPVPIIGGARLTGKLGRNSLAVMDIQTDGAFGNPGENFLVARYSRDIFANSRIGGIVINKEANLDEAGPDGGGYNRTYGLDVRLVPHPALTLDGMLARTSTPGATRGEGGAHVRAGWLDRSWRVYAEHTDLEEDFNPEVGFVPRVGVRRSKLHLEYNPRPDVLGIRMMMPMWNVTYFADQDGRLLSRRFHQMLGVRMDDGGFFNVWYNRNFERLEEPFAIRPDVTIPAGDYTFGDWNFSYDSNPAGRFFYGLRYAPQTFFGGDRTDVSASTGFRLTDQVAFEGTYTRNDVDLPGGDFTVDIASLQLDLALSPAMSLRTRTQYNSSGEQWTTSARFRWIYRPGSELFLVYDEVRTDPTRFNEFVESRDRQLIVKATYLLSF